MIVLQDAYKKYGDFQFHMSMEIPEGRITGLVGRNGAGKSTAIRLLLGLAQPDSGKVEVFGTESRKLTASQKQMIGVSLAESGFSGQLTVSDVEHILKKMYSKFDQAFFDRKCLELKIPKNQKIKTFSTGMKARLRVLAAMTHGAQLLIMDEPTAGLDVEARNEILDMLRDYIAADEKCTILITSHIASDLEHLCDDIYMIHEGKIILHEDTDILLEQYGILKVNQAQYESMEKEFILKTRKESYGYACLTGHRQFYQENYPGIVVEDGGIDELILMMTGGYR